MIITYHCPVCENRPTIATPLLFYRRPIVAQCPYCGAVIEIVARKQLAKLNVKDVLLEAEMILAGSKS